MKSRQIKTYPLLVLTHVVFGQAYYVNNVQFHFLGKIRYCLKINAPTSFIINMATLQNVQLDCQTNYMIQARIKMFVSF